MAPMKTLLCLGVLALHSGIALGEEAPPAGDKASSGNEGISMLESELETELPQL